MSAYREYVRDHEVWFRGRHPETAASLNRAEDALGLSLPADIRWVLTEYGYWHATGISSLAEAVERTLAARDALSLPPRFVVLFDRGDAGAYILDSVADSDTGAYRVYDVAWEDVPDHLERGMQFDSLVDYAASRIEDEGDFLDASEIACNPAGFGDGTS